MKTTTRIKLALLPALALVLSLGLAACSDDSLTSPADPAPLQSIDEAWRAEIDAMSAQVGADVMVDLAPQLEQARAAIGDSTLKHGRRLYLSYATTSFDEEFIYYEGWSNIAGHVTAVATFVLDYSHDPFIQTTVTTITDGDGDDLVLTTDGFFTVSDDGLDIEFWGRGDFTDGSGDYEDATGSARYIGDADFVTASGRILYFGWISLSH